MLRTDLLQAICFSLERKKDPFIFLPNHLWLSMLPTSLLPFLYEESILDITEVLSIHFFSDDIQACDKYIISLVTSLPSVYFLDSNF